jgi:orotate phosphoribosyltransferase
MTQQDVLKEFEEANAILRGHFVLSSGLHSDTYLQCARVMMDAQRGERLCSLLAERVKKTVGKHEVDVIVSPAMGGVIVGYEMGRQLNVPAVFCERENGEFTIRRGFSFPADAKVLVVEDVVTTGKSSNECIESIESYGGKVVAEACLINRSGGNPLNVPLISLVELEIQTYTDEDLPLELTKLPVEKPGSRWIT